MSNFFQKIWDGIEKPFEWGADILQQLPKVIKAGKDLKADVPTVVAEVTVLVEDIDAIVGTGSLDFAQFVLSTKQLWPAVVAAAAAGGTNLTLDLALVPLVEAAIANGKNFDNEFSKVEKLGTDFIAFRNTLVAEIAQLKSDFVTATPATVGATIQIPAGTTAAVSITVPAAV